MKTSYAPQGLDAAPVEFTFYVLRDDEPEGHTFKARPQAHAGDLLKLLTADDSEEGGERAFRALVSTIAKSMVNKDGVPAQWSPDELPRVERADPPAYGYDQWPSGEPRTRVPDDEPDEREPSYRGPDGVIYPLSDAKQLARFTDPQAGSSRRRWLHLMNNDDECTVTLDSMLDLAKDLIAAAAGRPTSGRP